LLLPSLVSFRDGTGELLKTSFTPATNTLAAGQVSVVKVQASFTFKIAS
jgi:hypothetical protein